MARIQVQRKLVPNDGTAEIGLIIMSFGRRLDRWGSILGRQEGITGIERLIPELQVQQAMIVARSRFGDYFRPAVPDAAELRTEWIIADADFLNLVLWRDAATGEPIDYKSGVAAGAATRARNFLQILREFVFVIRQRIDELFTKNRCLKT